MTIGLLLVPSNLKNVAASPGVSGTVWFFPKYDYVYLYPHTGSYTTLQLWVSPDPSMGNTTGIQQIDVWVPKDVNNLAYYRVVNVEVALFNITSGGMGSWVLAPPNWTVSLLDVDSNNAPRHIKAVANNPAEDAIFYNKTNPDGSMFIGYFRMAVFLLTVEWTRLPLTNGLASVDWAVTLSGTDFTSQFHPAVTHFVDNEPPTYTLSSSTQSLLSGPCLSSTAFNFSLTINDNSGLVGINYSQYGPGFFTWESTYNSFAFGEPGNDMYLTASPSGDPNDALLNTTWNIIFNPWDPASLSVPYYPFILPNASTYPGLAYVWGELVVIANDSSANYTQVYPLVSWLGTDSFMALNPATGTFGVDLGPSGPWVGGMSPALSEFTVKFYVILFDGTIDYTASQDNFVTPATNYNVIATNGEANYLLDLVGEIFYDVFQHPLLGATITGGSSGTSMTVLGSTGSFGSWSEGSFVLNWSWGTFGPDPTFQYFHILIYHEDSNTLFVNTTTTSFSLSWDVWDTGIGNYNFTIAVVDCGGSSVEFTGFLTVTEFVIVKLNGVISKWANYPSWLEIYQGDVVNIDIRTFGRAWNEPYQAVNISVFAQNTTIYPPGVYTVIANDTASLVGGTSTYGEWSYVIDVAADLSNMVGIYNVSAVWFNTSTSSVIASDVANTFLVKPVMFMDFWSDDSEYTTGETVTFFAHVYDLFGNDIDNATVAVWVWDPTNYLIATTAGVTFNGYVIPEVYGTVTFGVHVGDSWEPGTYTAQASTAVTSFVGNWFNGTTWLNLTSTSTITQTLTFDVTMLRLMDIELKLDDLKVNMSSVLTKLDTVLSDLSSISNALSNLQNTLNSVASDVTSLMSDMNTVLSTLSDMSNTLSTVASDVANLVTAVNNLNAAVNDVKNTLSGLASDLSNLSDQLNSLSSQLSDVQSALQNLATKSQVEEVAGDLDQLMDNVSSTFGQLSSLLMATAVLVIITLIVAAVTTFKVFRS